jgi:hypothetical protein
MPLTDELGRQALELMADRLGGEGHADIALSTSLNFESWLSLLSEDQPQLSDAANRDNQALFAHLRDLVAACLLDAQRKALAGPAPGWLYEFVSVLHATRATVITFNYDCLVETAVATHELWDPRHREVISPGDALQNLPPLPNVGARLVGPLLGTFRLLKLHGSLDWWAVPGDVSGATLNREQLHGIFGDQHEMLDEQRRRELPGRERFIIPPLSAKGGYYRNPLTRELWQQSHHALREATRVSLVGYSLPEVDLVVANLLRAAVESREVAIDIVNPCPEPIAERLEGLGASRDAMNVVDGYDCVETFSRDLAEEASGSVLRQLADTSLSRAADTALAVAWGSTDALSADSVRRVVGLVDRRDGTLELTLEAEIPHEGATGTRFADDGRPDESSFPSAQSLASKIDGRHRIVAQAPDGDHTLVAVWEEGRAVGASARWIFFAPAGARRR